MDSSRHSGSPSRYGPYLAMTCLIVCLPAWLIHMRSMNVAGQLKLIDKLSLEEFCKYLSTFAVHASSPTAGPKHKGCLQGAGPSRGSQRKQSA